ncbi:MAG TPA: hypothetical protein VKR78_03680 [Acidimicrobiales bacterium]|nr:hypothetical protein [Acidimicrobiales bacterium]
MLHALRRTFQEPLAAKVPEITLLFWVVKIVTTAGGEAASDYLALDSVGKVVGGAIEILLLLVALAWQFRTRRYHAAAYWFLAYAIAVAGTGVADFLHLVVGISYTGTTAIWALILAGIFVVWHRSERTLSIHSITTTRREAYYWATVFATFALGTALGDFTAQVLGLGYFGSAAVFLVVILVPALAWWRFDLNSVVAFWCSYVVTRPLGASIDDYLSKPHSLSGIGLGDGTTALGALALLAVLVGYLIVVRPDVQPSGAHVRGRRGSGSEGVELGRVRHLGGVTVAAHDVDARPSRPMAPGPGRPRPAGDVVRRSVVPVVDTGAALAPRRTAGGGHVVIRRDVR